MKGLVAETVGGVVGADQPQRPGFPTGLLDRLAARGLLGRLARVEPAGGHFPAPYVGDEAMTVDQQDAAIGIADDGRRGGPRRAHNVVFEADAGRKLDVEPAVRSIQSLR